MAVRADNVLWLLLALAAAAVWSAGAVPQSRYNAGSLASKRKDLVTLIPQQSCYYQRFNKVREGATLCGTWCTAVKIGMK